MMPKMTECTVRPGTVARTRNQDNEGSQLMTSIIVRAVFAVFLSTVAGATIAQQTIASLSVDTSGGPTDARLVSWAQQMDAGWDAITPRDTSGVMTITNLRVPFGEVIPGLDPLVLVIPEVAISDNGEDYSGQIERLRLGMGESFDFEYDLVGGIVRIENRTGNLHVTADKLAFRIIGDWHGPFANWFDLTIGPTVSALKTEMTEMLYTGQDHVIELGFDQTDNSKRWFFSTSVLSWTAQQEVEFRGEKAILRQEGFMTNSRQTLLRSPNGRVRSMSVSDGTSMVRSLPTARTESYYDDFVANLEFDGDKIAGSFSSTGGWSIQRDRSLFSSASSTGPIGLALSIDPDTGISMSGEVDDLRIVLDESRVPANGANLDLSSVEPMAFRMDLNLMPTGPARRNLLRQLPQRIINQPQMTGSEMLTSPWVLDIRKLSYTGWGAELNASANVALSMTAAPNVSGKAYVVLSGLPTFLSNLKANFDLYRQAVPEVREKMALYMLEYMSFGDSVFGLYYSFQTDASGMWLLNGRPLNSFVGEATAMAMQQFQQ